MARDLFPGMGEAVAARTVLRKNETWGDVAKRVAIGNCGITGEDPTNLERHIGQASVLMSGRHLQHGDHTQRDRNIEVFTNCSTSAQRSLTFYLLLNGSGVGSSYDDAICIVDYRNMPKVICTIDADHDDVVSGKIKGYPTRQDVPGEAVVFHVPDSREGWAQAVEEIEVAAWERTRRDETLILDFSGVRPNGAPIMGMQGRPASGPGPLMDALTKVALVRDMPWKPWRQSLQIDHELAECVLVGGARRSARMATKSWRDPDILEFISVKKDGGLWTANNSVAIDDEFWTDGGAVLTAILEAQYDDRSGEPGILNVQTFTKGEGRPTEEQTLHMGGNYQLGQKALELRRDLWRAADKMQYPYITNPCVTADTWVQTAEGPRQVRDLSEPFMALVDGKTYPSTGFWSTGVKPVFRLKTDRGYEMRLTANHKVLTSHGWVEAQDLKPSDKIVLQRQSAHKSDVEAFKKGWAIGHITGDGSYNPVKYPTVMAFWPQDDDSLVKIAEEVGGKTHTYGNTHGIRRVSTRNLDKLCEGMIEVLSKRPTARLEASDASTVAGFISGLFDSDGSVEGNLEKGRSIRLTLVDLETLKIVQRMLARFGVLSTIYTDRKPAGVKSMPGGDYYCQASHSIVISRDNMHRFYSEIGFMDPAKREKIEEMFDAEVRATYREMGFAKVVSVDPDGDEEVFDCTVDDVHRFDANGITSHNCGEIRLHALGSYCVIADVVPFFAKDDDDAEDAFREATRALMRTNKLPAIYQGEVDRTNRIGVGFTGIHEYALARFGLTFKDLVAEGTRWIEPGLVEPRHLEFWNMLRRWANIVDEEAPGTATRKTVKPAGTTSKLFGLTEGIHLPAMREYLRWVQFRSDDPLIAEYREKGYPTRELKTYSGTTIVGFPTRPMICDLGGEVTTAAEATPQEQFRWLRLMEHYWLGDEGGNQLSYTLKYDPAVVSKADYFEIMKSQMPHVRAVSVMPQIDTTIYEYQPEEPITRAEYDRLFAAVVAAKEDVDLVHVDCAGGACPVYFEKEAA
jgi:ribonucleotide reductase alpha subunit